MLSADPTVPNPSDLQAYNRYSYVLNNPLRYTDPSGFSSEEDKDQNEEIESSEDGGDLSESVTSETLNEGADVEGIPIRDSGIEIKDEEYSSGKTSYKTREISINGTVVSQQFAFRTEGEDGEEYSASGIQHIGFSQLGDTGGSFENKLAGNRIDTSGLRDIGMDRINGDITGELSLNTEGVVDNWAFLSGSGTQAHEQANQGSGGFFGISLRDVGEFAVGFVPYGGAVVALSKGDFRGAAIEAAVETAIIGAGALTGGAGYALLKTARNAKRAAKVANKLDNVFPNNADDLLSGLPRDAKGRIYPSDKVRIRPEQHALEAGETYAPRHHGQHYHVETRIDPAKSWNNKKNVTKIKPADYVQGEGTGFLPGEIFPGL